MDGGIAIPQAGLPIAQGFHLGSEQNYPCLVRVFDEVVVIRFFVLTDDLYFAHDSLSIDKTGVSR